ncbi:hypothetical protein ATKI12_0512 [Kitasatospora sp. Ki12]
MGGPHRTEGRLGPRAPRHRDVGHNRDSRNTGDARGTGDARNTRGPRRWGRRTRRPAGRPPRGPTGPVRHQASHQPFHRHHP